jgi:hypothetical protein
LLQILTTGAVEANEGILGDGMCCGYGDGSAVLYTIVDDDADALVKSSNGLLVMSTTKSM